MSGFYFTDLPEVLRAGGIEVIEVPGWQTRARGSGGFTNNRIEGMTIHHTAERPAADGWPSVNYMTFNAKFSPLANCYIDRKGRWWIMAAGATNTSGAGGPWHKIPSNSANSRTLGIEVANDGAGEAYTMAQQMTLMHGCALLWNHLAKRFNWGVELWRVFGHFEWAPSRKIDPAGPSTWTAHSDRYRRWGMDAFRHQLLHHAISLEGKEEPPAPPPPQDPEDPKSPPLKKQAGRYYIRRGDSPWSVASRVYGSGSQYPKLTQANPGTWHPEQTISVPGVEGYLLTVADGEGPYALIRRAGLPTTNARLADFYIYNGGENRMLRPGDVVFVKG